MFAIIRIRGSINLGPKVKKAFEILSLSRVNTLVLLPETPVAMGQLKAVKDYATYGKINAEVLTELLKKRGRLEGNKKITKEFLDKQGTNLEDMVKGLNDGSVSLKKQGIKKVFRLNSPSKGHARGGIKKHFNVGGVLGNRGDAINDLIRKMM